MASDIDPESDGIPEVTDELLAGITSAYDRSEMRAQLAIDDASMLRRAAQTVWYRRCDTHHCTEGLDCLHRNHRRDVDALEHLLEILGITSASGEDLVRSSSVCLSHVDS
jgi:hypothetical protein